jgi:hypothetical protein
MIMFLTYETKIEKQFSTLPEGYELITAGKLEPGDIRWNNYEDCWNLDGITDAEKHKIVIGDDIKGFAGVCRRKEAK